VVNTILKKSASGDLNRPTRKKKKGPRLVSVHRGHKEGRRLKKSQKERDVGQLTTHHHSVSPCGNGTGGEISND